jgi:hypothetical protein
MLALTGIIRPRSGIPVRAKVAPAFARRVANEQLN